MRVQDHVHRRANAALNDRDAGVLEECTGGLAVPAQHGQRGQHHDYRSRDARRTGLVLVEQLAHEIEGFVVAALMTQLEGERERRVQRPRPQPALWVHRDSFDCLGRGGQRLSVLALDVAQLREEREGDGRHLAARDRFH